MACSHCLCLAWWGVCEAGGPVYFFLDIWACIVATLSRQVYKVWDAVDVLAHSHFTSWVWGSLTFTLRVRGSLTIVLTTCWRVHSYLSYHLEAHLHLHIYILWVWGSLTLELAITLRLTHIYIHIMSVRLTHTCVITLRLNDPPCIMFVKFFGEKYLLAMEEYITVIPVVTNMSISGL